MYFQKWTLKKIFCYLTYRVLAKHISSDFIFIGKFGQYMRRVTTRPLLAKTNGIFTIGRGVDIDNGCFIEMKDHSNIGDECILTGNNGRITIGKHVMMGKRCIIISQNHKYTKDEFIGFEGKDIIIGDYSWIGHGVTILPGVEIGEYSIIGAGAVVSKSIPKHAIAVGNPARVIKYRKD